MEKAAPGYSRAAFSMAASARVVPFSCAARATSPSAIKHATVPPSFARLGLLTPAFAILVSVTMDTPCRSAATPRATASGVKHRLCA